MRTNFKFPNDGLDARYYMNEEGLHITIYLTLNKYVGYVLFKNGISNIIKPKDNKNLYILRYEEIQSFYPFEPEKGYTIAKKKAKALRKGLTRDFLSEIEDLMLHSELKYL